MNHLTVWVFCGSRATFPSGVFPSKESADSWIRKNLLTGTLTEYPVGVGVYDWAVQGGLFNPKKPEHSLPQFIQSFSSASQKHFHYENGE